MFKKIILIISLVVVASFMLVGCNSNEIFPEAIPLENSIKEIILSKGENYDFLNDELFMSKVDEYASTLIKIKSATAKYYAIGNLDKDNIPELVVFIERNPKKVDDQGGLGVYKFTGEKYELLDKVNMNYDNTNYLLEVGRISPTQNGILLSNQVGAHSAITYGFILENGKLKSILNDKKISLISVYTSNEIKDIDNDGILEFSIYTVDPETEEQSSVGSDKLILWYKWDENDSGELIKVERDLMTNNIPHTMAKVDQLDIEEIANDKLINYLNENKQKFDRTRVTEILDDHIRNLYRIKDNQDAELTELLNKYTKNHISEKYELSIERLNDVEYLKREKVLQSESDLKEHLITSINMGYRLDTAEGMYFYIVDYQKFLNNFGDIITKQFRDYLRIKATNSNEPYLKDGALTISLEKLAERIAELENYKLTYPYSKHLNELNEIYNSYILNFLFGSVNTPTYDLNTNKFNENLIPIFSEIATKFEHTYFADIIKDFIKNLNLNLNIIDDTLKENTTKLLK